MEKIVQLSGDLLDHTRVGWGVCTLENVNTSPFIHFICTGVLFDWTLLLYGTEADPIKGNWHIHAPLANTPPTTTSSKIKATEAPKAFPGRHELHKKQWFV